MVNEKAFLFLSETNEMFAITCPATVGSARDSDVVLEHPYPEPIQVLIRAENGEFRAKVEQGSFKVKSKLGIFPIAVWTTINGKPLKSDMPIQDGDCLKIGANIYWFSLTEQSKLNSL
ncbi:MAG TPA: FHA domain-containing protein [Oculatellaceae cyanobacterium]